ncbi:MAG: DUF3618 domain-containing protein [Actinomycetota bacterium]|nr:DUF3618 domain-containing protein [Actinomycetota bacterium]
MTAANQSQPEPSPDAGVDDLQADIERTRAELGKTTQALTDKLDVKARAADAASDAKERVVEKAQEVKSTVLEQATTADGSVKPAVPVGAIVAAALLLGIVVWRRRNR